MNITMTVKQAALRTTTQVIVEAQKNIYLG